MVQKYSAALTSVAIVVLTALIAIPSGQLGLVSALQIAAIGVAAVATYFSPLANIKWKGAIKTGVAVISALITALLPLANNGGFAHITPIQIAIIVLAVINALGVEIGVNIRTDTSTLTTVIDHTPLDSSVDQYVPVPEDDADVTVNSENEEDDSAEPTDSDDEVGQETASNP